MNNQLDLYQKFPKHNPFKFLRKNQIQNGFQLENSNQTYLFDELKGWADQDGCYYDYNGFPAGWVFVRKDKYIRYNMDCEEVKTDTNIYYPQTIFEEETQKEEMKQQNSQKSFQKSSDTDLQNTNENQLLDNDPQFDKFKKPSASLKEHQQNFQKYVQENNIQLNQIYFKQRHYSKVKEIDYKSQRQRVRSEHTIREYRYYNDQNKFQDRNYQSIPRNHFGYQDQRNQKQYYLTSSNSNLNDQNSRKNVNNDYKPYYNKNVQQNLRNYNQDNNQKRYWNKYNNGDQGCFEQYHQQKHNNNNFIQQSYQQYNYKNGKDYYQDNKIYDNHQDDNSYKQRNFKYQQNHGYKKYYNRNDYGNSFPNTNKLSNNENNGFRQQNIKQNKYQWNKDSKQFKDRNEYKGDFYDQKQQFQYILCKDNSFNQIENNQQNCEREQKFIGKDLNQDQKDKSKKRERKSRLNENRDQSYNRNFNY